MLHLLPWRRPEPPADSLKESEDALREARQRELATAATLRRRQREKTKNHFARDIKRAFGV